MTQTCLSHKQRLLVAGTLFGMFFGAGNLIFPVHLGQLAGRQFLPAAIGFILTAVGIPILGVAAIGSTHSEGLQDLSRRVGHRYSYFFTCLLYLTIGPFFAIPRCATTSFTAGVRPLLGTQLSEQTMLFLFSLIFFALVFVFSIRPGSITLWIGKIINPLFLLFLGVLIVTALLHPSIEVSAAVPDASYQNGAFFSALSQGYETMDAIAGLAFGIVVISVIRQMGVQEDSAIAKEVLHSGMLAGLLMAFIYHPDWSTVTGTIRTFRKRRHCPLPDCRLLPWTDGLLDPRHRDHIRLPQDLHRACNQLCGNLCETVSPCPFLPCMGGRFYPFFTHCVKYRTVRYHHLLGSCFDADLPASHHADSPRAAWKCLPA